MAAARHVYGAIGADLAALGPGRLRTALTCAASTMIDATTPAATTLAAATENFLTALDQSALAFPAPLPLWEERLGSSTLFSLASSIAALLGNLARSPATRRGDICAKLLLKSTRRLRVLRVDAKRGK